VEAGTFPSSYIPTRESTVTRAADDFSYSESGNVLVDQGSVLLEVGMGFANDQTALGGPMLWTTRQDDNNRIVFYYSGGDDKFYFQKKVAAAANNATSAAQTFSKYDVRHLLGTWGSGGVCIYTNGVAGTQNTNTDTAVIGTCHVGNSQIATYEGFSYIRRIVTFSRQLTAGQAALIEKQGVQRALSHYV